ncbi:hypothetical protein OESDEN_07961 [Oesophagostomum dentatum]|uniref:PI-PLC X domain-containing protein 3 n=1 Tax=Oesophagostomum dentatum TaxID=61180 RepID=A0A0B1T7S4_OESDE|nr:hypothetical protein OESDEN_07961 [Oesophagostomum dentatum]
MSLANWMAELPPELTSRPIYSLKIPGSHDSGANDCLSEKLPVANDEGSPIRELGKAPCIRRIIKRWAVTQSYSIRQQLDLGIRYLDMRVSYPPIDVRDSKTDFRLIHALYGPKLLEVFREIAEFLRTNTKEVILLDINHLYAFDMDSYTLLQTEAFKTLGRELFCPVTTDSVSLDYMWENGYRVIVFSSFASNDSNLFWPNYMIPSPWPNTNNVDALIQTLETCLNERCTVSNVQGFFVSQGVLTPKNYDVIYKFYSTLRDFSQQATGRVLQWLSGLSDEQKAKVNVVILDFIDEATSRRIISLNHTDSGESLETTRL